MIISDFVILNNNPIVSDGINIILHAQEQSHRSNRSQNIDGINRQKSQSDMNVPCINIRSMLGISILDYY